MGRHFSDSSRDPSVGEMPSHTHGADQGGTFFTLGGRSETTTCLSEGAQWRNERLSGRSSIAYTGGNTAHNNIPPYKTVYCFLRKT